MNPFKASKKKGKTPTPVDSQPNKRVDISKLSPEEVRTLFTVVDADDKCPLHTWSNHTAGVCSKNPFKAGNNNDKKKPISGAFHDSDKQCCGTEANGRLEAKSEAVPPPRDGVSLSSSVPPPPSSTPAASSLARNAPPGTMNFL
jgi:hypothetical protein